MKKERKKEEETSSPEAPANSGTHPILSIRRAGVPLVFIETADPAATIKGCIAAINGNKTIVVIAEHDVLRGLVGINKPGKEWAQRTSPSPTDTSNPAEFLDKISGVTPEGALIFFHNAHRFMNEGVIQGVWNLRDSYKGIQATLVMLGPAIDLPAELKNDVVVIEEPVPTAEDIEGVVKMLSKESGVPIPDLVLPKIVDTLLGYLSLFGVEQSAARAVTKEGWDLDQLWDFKVKALKTVAGLEIMRPKETFKDIEGTEGAKNFLRLYINGRRRPRAIFWVEELEKAIAGATSDLSGTTQAIVEQILYWTESRKVDAVLLTGVPGAGKSATARSTGGEAQCPVLRGSFSNVKGSLVGESERNMRNMLKAVDAVGQGRILMIATSNNPDSLPPEVMARFKLAQFFYDLPNDVEGAALWTYYIKKYDLKDEVPENTRHWVGREVESCCDRAWLFNIPLAEAAKTVVPIYVSQKSKIETMRKNANGRYLSASHAGPYTYAPLTEAPPTRKISV